MTGKRAAMDQNNMTTGEISTCYDLSKPIQSPNEQKEELDKCDSAEIKTTIIKTSTDIFSRTNNISATDQSHIFTTEAKPMSSCSNYISSAERFWDMYRLGNEAVSNEKSEMEKLYAKNDLLRTLRGILERNVNIKTEMLKYNLNKMLNVNKPQQKNEQNRNIKEFNQQEISFIEEQVDKILLEAQILVNGLVNVNFNCLNNPSNEADSYSDADSMVTLGGDIVLRKNENMLPLLHEEHILEAPEGFRSNIIQLSCDSPQKAEPTKLSDTGILLAERLKCHCDAAPVEPERPMVTNHGDDNKLTQEVDTCQRTERKETEACENDTTTTYEGENHASSHTFYDNEKAAITTITIPTIPDRAGEVNRDNELEKVHKEINQFKVDKNGMKSDAFEYANLKWQEEVSNFESTSRHENKTCNKYVISGHIANRKELLLEDFSVKNKLWESKKNKLSNDFKRKSNHLVVSDRPKSECHLEQFYSNNGYKDVNQEKLNEVASNVKTKSASNLIVTDKPRKKVNDKIFSDNSHFGHDKRKSSTRNERQEDNDHNGTTGVRHVGSTTTTPTHLLGDTSHRKVNCYCIECRNCNESTSTNIAIPKTVSTVFLNKCNLKENKVETNDSREDDRKHDKDKKDSEISLPRCISAVRDVSRYQCAESDVDTAVHGNNSDMPNSAAATTAAISQSSSIETGVERCAELPGCSRESTVSARVALDTSSCTFPTTTKQDSKISENDRHNGDITVNIQSVYSESTNEKNSGKNAKVKQTPTEHLTWSFKNGRLVFEDTVLSSETEYESENANILTSKDLNRKSAEGRQLKLLEQKLKQAGITDEIKPINVPSVVNQNIKNNEEKHDSEESELTDDEELIPEYAHLNLCEFDPNNTNLSSCLHFDNDADFYLVYDELLENEDLIVEMRGEGGMGTNVERKQHNPDHDNLKSLLKKPSHGKDTGKKNRVVFNETKNEFFDADYIILIREECDYDEEDDDGICTCNQHEMVRLTCCEPNCNCNAYDGYGDPTPQSPKFAPPLEFVDSVTLSPPEEYKDMELEEKQLIALQQIARRGGQRAPVCKECSASHEEEGKIYLILFIAKSKQIKLKLSLMFRKFRIVF